MIGFERNTCENAANESRSNNNIPSPEKKCLKRRMAQETGEDQSKKIKKWIENLSVLLSEDEEEFAYTAASHKKEKQSILENNKAIYLRFPYYMGSDNSDDEDGIKYFADISPKKREIKRVVSSSDEMNEISKENKSYKHTKRKQKSNRYVKKHVEYSRSKQHVSIESGKKQHKLKSGSHSDSEENSSFNNKENKESSKRVLKFKDSKSAKTSPMNEKNNSKPHSLKYSNKTIDSPSAVTRRLGDNIKEAPKKTSLRQSRAKAFGAVTCENVIGEKKEASNVAEQKDEDFQFNHNRFLDSSSENSNTEIAMVKTKQTKYKRVHVLSTSSSSSDSEDNPKKLVPQNLKQSENPSDEVQSKSLSKPETKLKPTACISSEEENYDNSIFEPPKGTSEKVFNPIVTNDLAESSNSISSGPNFQTKPMINANAWKSIAIADIKAQFNKQSKVEELKRKLVSSNAPSVAIYKKIQKREMLRNKSEPKGPISRPKLHQNRGFLHSNEKNACEMKFDAIPSTSALQRHDQYIVDSTLKNKIMESSDSKNCKSTFHLGIPEKKDGLVENGENAEKLHLPQFDLQFNLDSSPLEDDTNTSTYSKKVRQAHSKGLKSQNDHKKLNPHIKIRNQNLKHIQSSKENKSKELRHISDDASKNFDVLGNIMSQMDKNPFKIQKPANKKTEPTTETLGWFPAGSNASLCGQTQNATGLLQPRMDEFQLKHNMPIGITLPATNKTTFVTSNTHNPSYNPLCSALVSSNNTNQTGIENRADVELKNKEVLKVSESKQTSKIEENASCTTSMSSSGGRFVPFYSAPQEDYEGDDIRSKDKIANTKSRILKLFSESKTDNQSDISNNKPSNLENNKGNESSLEGLSKNPISQEPRVSQVLYNNKDSLPSAVDKSENLNHQAKIITKPLHTNKSISGKNNLEPIKHSKEPLKVNLSKPQDPLSSGFTRGNGAICKELKKNNSNSNNNSTQKGIRVRYKGTEFRLPMKPSGNLATKGSGISEGQSERDPAVQKSSSNVKDLTTDSDDVKAHKSEVVNSMANETGEVSANPVSSSSTTSSSSLDNSSSSTVDSSSESSDEDEKPSSVEGSSSDSRSNSPENYVTDNIQSQISSQVQTQGAPTDNKDLSLQPVQDHLICSKMKAKYSSATPNNKSNDEVIILSGSSDSDSNDVLQYKGIDPQLPGEVDKIKNQLDNRKDCTEELTASQAEKSELNSDKVGKIRVKSLKELGVIHDLKNENALGPLQICEVSQAKSKEQQKQICKVSQIQSKEQQKKISEVSQVRSKEQQMQIREVSQAQSKDQQNQICEVSQVQSKEQKNQISEVTQAQSEDQQNQICEVSQVRRKEQQKQISEVSQVQSKEQQKQICDVSQAQSKDQQKQICEISQVQSNEHQKSQLDTPSSSNANTVSDKLIHQIVTNFLSSDKTSSDNQIAPRVPEQPNLYNDMLVKQPIKPITTVFLPIVPIAVINPVNSARVRPIVSSLNQEKNKESSSDPGSGNSSLVVPSVSSQTIASGSAISSNQETSQNPADVVTMPVPSEGVKSLFFKLCDELFTEVVLFKIPKLADDLHLLIAYDIMKEERLKKIDQLINADTIASEKRRAEKEFADMIKIRGQSFVPLFMTIVKKILKKHQKTLLMAVYCRIVQQLVRIDPVNSVYRYKIKNIIKSMLQKNRQPDWDVKQDIVAYFHDEMNIFLSHFHFIEDLLDKYDNYVAQRHIAEVQNINANETSQPNMETPESSERINEDTDSSVSVSGLNQTCVQTPNMPAEPLPPSIGNLDQLFCKRNLHKK